MDVNQLSPMTDSPTVMLPPDPEFQQCDECGSPVEVQQRYCVVCGSHRRHVEDPAARYLSQATARTRNVRAGRAPARPSPGSHARGLGIALVLALVPAAAAVGVTVGRSTDSSDAKLIQALERHQAQAATSSALAAGGTAASTPASGTGARSGAGAKSSHKRAHSAAKASSGSNSAGNAASSLGISSKPSASQVQQGAQDTQKVQKSTGKTYVNGQDGLPGTVVVP